MEKHNTNILTDLYHGNFVPEDLLFTNPPKDLPNEQLLELQDKIKDSVPIEIWRMINESYSLMNLQSVFDKERVFVCGFQTATKLFLAGLGKDVKDISFI